MIYATAAKGFRPGGIVPPVPVAPGPGLRSGVGRRMVSPQLGAPVLVNPDNLWSYELGSKNAWLNDRVTVNAAAFYMTGRISNKEVLCRRLRFTANAGAAKSEGGEIEVHAHPVQALDVSTGLGYQHAVITATGPGSPLEVGERVFQVPGSDGNFGATFTSSLGDRYNGVFNVAYLLRWRQY